ncbi:DNA primase [Helicobacter bizzozeronii]|uniref:DNA primase n=1 Tax=Helicobacter bizzozeronii TaxID=56877 RepID=UPI000CEF4938|nr:DNA primase [Helicobacter bizzozeronii]
MIKDTSLEQLKAVVDIVDVVGSYIELKRVGAGFSAICPFHNEKTPSFKVNPATNAFRCFGCGVSGNAITFVMEYEKIGFQEAVEKLATRYDIALERTNQRAYEEQKGFLGLLEQITACYQEILEQTPKALEYLKGRGINEKSIQEFQLGYCDSWQVLGYIEKNKLDKQALHHLGVLAYNPEGKEYASLFGRIIFPIQNSNGKIVAFGGRALQEGDVKYINSATSATFNKSKILYGYPQARLAILKEQKMLLTEGYIDVILAHQAGIKIAVATLGTALSADHLPLMHILKERSPIIMAYDMDNAGQEATMRAIELLSQNLKYGGVVELESGLDVADMVAQGKITQLKEALSKPVPFIEYSLKRILNRYDLGNFLDKDYAVRECRAVIDALPEFAPHTRKGYTEWLKEHYGLEFVDHKYDPPKQEVFKDNPTGRNYVEEAFLYILLKNPALFEEVRPFMDIKYFTEAPDAKIYQDFLEGKLNTPQQVAFLAGELNTRYYAKVEEGGDIVGELREYARRMGQEYWYKHWVEKRDAEPDIRKFFDLAAHVDLIEGACGLESLPLLHIVPNLKGFTPYLFPQAIKPYYNPRKMILAVDDFCANDPRAIAIARDLGRPL